MLPATFAGGVTVETDAVSSIVLFGGAKLTGLAQSVCLADLSGARHE